MKTKMNKTGIMGITLKMTLLLNIFLLGLSCEDKPVYWEPKNQDLVITDYVLAHDDDFSEFSKVLNYTGIDNLLRVRGPFTLLLPTDEGMKEYYADLNVTDYTQIEMDVLTTMVKNHIFTHEITTASIGLGTLPYANANGDNVASDLPDIEIVLNKTATIIHRDIDVSNGYIQEIDKVLKPVTKNVIEVLDSYEGYSIFIEGLARTGLEDTLKIIEFPFGNATARAWFTILAVPDTLFNRFGIYTIDDLINKYSDSGDLTDRENGFYKYMLYHCLSEANYFSDFAPRDVYYLISYDNYLNIRVEKDFKINKTDSSYTGFYFDLSNIPAKNGAIHTINSLLPYIESDPEPVLFQTTDFFDIKQGPYYHNFYESFYDGQNTFKELKWDGEYLMYYIKPG
ncbi:MAG: fasciclin domain-containing protein, partial [Bacteroidales bacterium]|nr:fasciclin domain-containing protein [Bacteroidales bacterium]